ncbi:MAG: hypothetical protein J6J13_03290 [Clostridia bacterium]|nr:hypothetical protein [Clostridia bacterium]
MAGINFDPSKIYSDSAKKQGIDFDPSKIYGGGDPSPDKVITSIDANGDGSVGLKDLVRAKKITAQSGLDGNAVNAAVNQKSTNEIKNYLLSNKYQYDSVVDSTVKKLENNQLSSEERKKFIETLEKASIDDKLTVGEKEYYSKLLNGYRHSGSTSYEDLRFNDDYRKILNEEVIVKNNYSARDNNLTPTIENITKYGANNSNNSTQIKQSPKIAVDFETLKEHALKSLEDDSYFYRITGHSKASYLNNYDGYTDSANADTRLKSLNSEEAALLIYISKTQGQKEAWNYLTELRNDLGSRKQLKAIKDVKNQYDRATIGGKIGLNALSVVNNVFAAPVAAADVVKQYALNGEFDAYTDFQIAQAAGGQIRQSTAEEIEKKVDIPILKTIASKTYGAVMSGMDMTLGAFTFGSVGKYGYTATMALGAGANKARDLYARGASQGQIAIGAVASAAIEFFIEMGVADTIENVTTQAGVKKLLKQMNEEGFEELGSDIGDMVVESIVMGKQSASATEVRNLMQEEGISEGEAWLKVLGEKATDMFWDYYGGAVSVGTMRAPATVAYTVSNHSYGNKIQNKNNTQSLIDMALTLPEDSEAYGIAKEVKDKNGKVSTSKIGELFKATASYVSNIEGTTMIEAVEKELKRYHVADSADVARTIVAMARMEDVSPEIRNGIFNNRITNKVYLELISGKTDTLGRSSGILQSKASTSNSIAEWVREYERKSVNYLSAQLLVNELLYSETKSPVGARDYQSAAEAFSQLISDGDLFNNKTNQNRIILADNMSLRATSAVTNKESQKVSLQSNANEEGLTTESGNEKATSNDEAASFMPENGERNDTQVVPYGEDNGGAEPVVPINGYGKRHLLNKKEQEEIKEIAKKLGRTVVFEHISETAKKLGIDTSKGIPDGYYDSKGIIHIDYAPVDPVRFVFKHELTHFTESIVKNGEKIYTNVQYDRFVKLIKKSGAFRMFLENELPAYKDENSERLLAKLRQIEMDKRSGDKKFTPYDAECEVIANFVGKMLFTENGYDLDGLLSGLDYKERNIVIQYITDFFNWLIERFKDDTYVTFEIRRMEYAFNRALSEATATKPHSPNNGEVQFSIVNLDTGKSYVRASRKVINGNNVAEWRAQITNFFNKSLKNGPIKIETIEGDVLTISKETANKARSKAVTENGIVRELTDKEFLVKLNAEAHIDELAEISKKNRGNIVLDSKNHSFSKDGFTYRTVYFQDFDDAYYKVTLSVGENNGVSTVYNVGKIKADDIPDGNIISTIGSKADMSSDTYNIPENGDIVNNNSMSEIEKDTSDIKFSFARVYDDSVIEKAEQTEAELKAGNKSVKAIRRAIWKKYHIIRDTDGVWVYEIDDSDMKLSLKALYAFRDDEDYEELMALHNDEKLTPDKYQRYLELYEKMYKKYNAGIKLGDCVKHDKLFEKYPQLKDINIVLKNIGKNNGLYDSSTKTITINPNVLTRDLDGLQGIDYRLQKAVNEIDIETTLLHEIQHAMQDIDSREMGSNVEYWKQRLIRGERLPINPQTGKEFTPEEAYEYTNGEYEARETQSRKAMNDKEREAKMPDLGWGKTISAKEMVKASDFKFSIPSDSSYMAAVESGDIESAQAMTDNMAKAAGYSERLYHQTGADFTVFNTKNQKAGKYDYELPTGTFLKPGDNDIGLSGKKQMGLYAKFQNPLSFADRAEAQKFWSDNIPEYKAAIERLNRLNSDYRQRVDEAEADVQDYITEWRKNSPNAQRRDVYNDPEFQRLYDIQQDITEEWDKAEGELSVEAKSLIDGFISESGYDGIIIERDDDGKNRYTKSYIAFSSVQMKSADPVTYDDNGEVIPLSERFNVENEDIRFSVPKQKRNYIEEVNTLNQQLQNGEITGPEFNEQIKILWEESDEEYGTIEKGETVSGNENFDNPVPKTVDGKKPVRRHVRTILEGGELTEGAIEITKEKILKGEFSYEPTSNEKNLKAAKKILDSGHAEDRWSKIANGSGKISGKDVAIGEMLLKRAITQKNAVDFVKYTSELCELATRAGQTVQAFSLLKRLDGVGQLYYVQKAVNNLNNELMNKFKSGKDVPQIVIDETLALQLASSKTAADFEITYQAILTDIASQVPATWIDKLNAWRYFAMLANPKTHIKNLIGNAVFMPSVGLKRYIAAGLEHMFVEESERTKVVFLKPEYKEFAAKDIKRQETRNMLKGQGMLDEKGMINSLRKTYETKWLEAATSGNSNLLEAEDMLFKSHHYKVALASFLQARKADLNDVSESLLLEARTYAVKEAKKATYQDISELANYLNNIKVPVIKGLVEGFFPFKKTPINIIKRGVEYSPIGFVTTLADGLVKVRKGEFSCSQFVDGIAAGLTGTGLMAIGMFLRSMGWIVGGFGNDEEDKFRQLNGEQEYSVQIFGVSYTIDWAAPSNIPFFIGVELMEELQENDGVQLKDITEALWNTLEPMTNLSMLSGVQGAIDAVRHEDQSRTISNIVSDVALSYAMQYIPSAFGATSRTMDPTQRTWYTDKNSQFSSVAQSAVNNVKSKIPGLSYTMPEKIDAWGRTVSRGNIGERLAENIISPGYYSSVYYDDVNTELKRIFVKTGAGVLPRTAAKSFVIDGKTKYLTADEYVKFAKAKGEMSFDYVKEFTDSSIYNKLDDSEKAEVIENLYSFANAKAKTEVSDYDPSKIDIYKGVSKYERNGGSAVMYYIYKVLDK